MAAEQELGTQMMGDEETQIATQPEPVDSFFAQKHPEDEAAREEADNMAMAQVPEAEKTCFRCKSAFPAEEIGKNKQCKACNALRSALNRHFGKEWPLEDFQRLSNEEQEKFWKSAGQFRDGKGLLSFQRVKTHLSTIFTKSRFDRDSVGSGGSYQPLSVYAAQGYDTGKIMASCPRMFNEFLQEECFLVELVSVNKETISETVTKEMNEIERRVWKRKTEEKALEKADLSSDEDGPVDPEGATAEELEELRSKKRKLAEKKEKAAEKKEKKKAEKALAKEKGIKQKEIRELINKTCTPLQQVYQQLQKTEGQKNLVLTEDDRSRLTAAVQQMGQWRDAVLNNLAKFAKNQGAELDDLPFDKSSYGRELKRCKLLVQEMRAQKAEAPKAKSKARKGGA